MPGTQNPKTPQTPAQAQAQLVKIEELPQAEFKTWRLYSDAGEPLPLYVRYMGGTWWALVPLRELQGVALGGAQAIIVTAESAAAAADALWRVLERLGVHTPYPVFAGP